jgi:tRNA threonylcarbamoyladenosine biosynthesis protein TsaE
MAEGRAEGLDLDALGRWGAALGRSLRPGDVVALSGALGAGKTTLARAVLAGAGHGGEVPSPTFSLVQVYDDTSPPVAHADLYRLDSAAAAEALGLDDLLFDHALLVEWPERLGAMLWPDMLWLSLEGAGGPDRCLTWIAPAAWEQRWPPIEDC